MGGSFSRAIDPEHIHLHMRKLGRNTIGYRGETSERRDSRTVPLSAAFALIRNVVRSSPGMVPIATSSG
jgi:hypothetical protein